MAHTVNNLSAVQETHVQSLGREYLLVKEWLSTPVFLPEEFHGQRSLVSYSSWGCKESDMVEQLTLSHFHFQQFFMLNLLLLYRKSAHKRKLTVGFFLYIYII